MNSNPASVGSGDCSRRDEARRRTLLGGRSSIHRGASRRDPHCSFSVDSSRPPCEAAHGKRQIDGLTPAEAPISPRDNPECVFYARASAPRIFRTHGVAQRTGNFEGAVAARVVGDDRRGVVLAARDTTADSRRLAGLDRRDWLHLGRGSARIWRMGWHYDDTVMTRRKPIS
jgi:hypothetical protein